MQRIDEGTECRGAPRSVAPDGYGGKGTVKTGQSVQKEVERIWGGEGRRGR